MDDLGLGFSADELVANRRGELLATQYPPLLWKVAGLCAILLVIVCCLRWAAQYRPERMRYLVAAVALVCLAPSGWLTMELWRAMRDRVGGHACAFTHLSSGVRASAWGLGLYFVDVGPRTFPSRGGRLARAVDVVQKGSAYTVHYACHSGYLASLEPAPSSWQLPGHTEHLAELEALFDFDGADLAANRMGNLRLRQFPFGRLAGGLFLAGLLAAATLACALELRKTTSVPVLLLGLLCGVIGVGVVYGKRALFRDALMRRTCSLAGTLTELNLRFGKTATYWRLGIDGTTLEFSQAAQGSSLLRVGSKYRVHYLCHSQQLASIEPLP